jgi:dihydrofolate reductase
MILKMSMSVDGFVCGSKSEVDWIFSSMDEGAVDWRMKRIWQEGVHIMGSRTFHDMASYWPSSSEVNATPMNEIPKVIFSKNPEVLSPAAKRAHKRWAMHRARAAVKPVHAQATPHSIPGGHARSFSHCDPVAAPISWSASVMSAVCAL